MNRNKGLSAQTAFLYAGSAQMCDVSVQSFADYIQMYADSVQNFVRSVHWQIKRTIYCIFAEEQEYLFHLEL